MNEVPDRVIGRIRKMLALANDAGASQGERDNAMRMAHATLAKYNLEMSAVGTTPDKPMEAEARVKHLATFYGRPWARIVASAVGELMFCKHLFITAGKAKDTTHLFIGSHANAVSASILAEFLVNSIIREGRMRQRQAGAGNAWFRSFAIGAAASIARRCAALRTAAETPRETAGGAPYAANGADPAPDSSPGSAVVLRSVYEREQAANEAYVTANVAVRPADKTPVHNLLRRTSLDPMVEGAQYGNKVSLNRQVK